MEAKRSGRMPGIRKEKVFTGSDHDSAEQRCRELDLQGLCGDVRCEDPEAPPSLFLSLSVPSYAPGNGQVIS
jgi:hypothetical protein